KPDTAAGLGSRDGVGRQQFGADHLRPVWRAAAVVPLGRAPVADREFRLVPVKQAVGFQVRVIDVLAGPVGAVDNGCFAFATADDNLRLVEALLRLIGAITAPIGIPQEHSYDLEAPVIAAEPLTPAA